MRNRTILLVSTILLAGLYIAGAAALGTTPGADDNGQSVVTWFRENGGHVRSWLWLATLSVLVFAVFASLIRRQLPAPYGDIFFFGAIALAVEGSAQGWILAGLSWHADRLDPATARTLLDVASFWGPVLTSTTILMLAPVTLLAWRRQAGRRHRHRGDRTAHRNGDDLRRSRIHRPRWTDEPAPRCRSRTGRLRQPGDSHLTIDD